MPKVGGLIIPNVHLNGTTREELVEQRKNAVNAVHNALEVLCYMRPHARDYFDKFEYEQAKEQHEVRIIALRKIIQEFSEEAIAIQVQGRV